MNKELLPCPFCGGTCRSYIGNFYLKFITCNDCGAMSEGATNVADAIKAWNTRQPVREKCKPTNIIKGKTTVNTYGNCGICGHDVTTISDNYCPKCGSEID